MSLLATVLLLAAFLVGTAIEWADEIWSDLEPRWRRRVERRRRKARR